MIFLVFLFTNLLCAASTTKPYDNDFTAKDVGKCCERYTEKNGSPAERLVPCGLYPSRVCADIQFEVTNKRYIPRWAFCSLPDWAYRCCSGEDAGCAGKGDGDTCHNYETDETWYSDGKCKEATPTRDGMRCRSGITTSIQCKEATETSKSAVKDYTLYVIIIVAIATAKFYLVWASRTACEGPCQFYGRCWRKICPSLCKANENDMEESSDEEAFRPLKQPQQLPVGAAVYALWTDGVAYSAKVTWCDPQGCFFNVEYDDGDEQKNVKFDYIHLITPVEPVDGSVTTTPTLVESTNGCEVVMEMTPITQASPAATTANVAVYPVTSIPVANPVDSGADDNTAQFCSKCGMERQEGYNFCPKCGTDMSIIVV